MHDTSMDGFVPNWIPDYLYDFQKTLVDWSLRKGRSAIFADCGLGKTPMQLVWAFNVARHTNKPVIIATPLAVSHQLMTEADKFDIQCVRVSDGKLPVGAHIVVTNYERLHHFDRSDFSGMVCDESSILKNFDGTRKAIVTEFMKKMPYRLLCTATAAPNDYIELGTSSEALGELGHMDMLARFFKSEQGVALQNRRFHGASTGFRFKHHAENPFWRWVCSWARAVRRPSDIGGDDTRFVLPPLTENEHIVKARTRRNGFLFDLPAVGLHEQREEARRTIKERCEKVSELTQDTGQSLVWCHLNDEGNLLEKIIPGAKQVAGSHPDELKEERLMSFQRGELRVLITKPKIGAWGLNMQKCSHVTFFPSHSYEQYYQGVRRCWRFGQDRPVTVDVVSTEGGHNVMANLQRKAEAADRMFTALVAHMNASEKIRLTDNFRKKAKAPAWM